MNLAGAERERPHERRALVAVGPTACGGVYTGSTREGEWRLCAAGRAAWVGPTTPGEEQSDPSARLRWPAYRSHDAAIPAGCRRRPREAEDALFEWGPFEPVIEPL